MRIVFNLYKVHDIDLVSLYLCPNFNFTTELKKVIRGYLNNTPYIINQPKEDFNYSLLRGRYRLSIKLNDSKDADIIEFLNSIQPHCRTSVLKAIMRGSIIGYSFHTCMNNPKATKMKENVINSIITSSSIKPSIVYPSVEGLDESEKTVKSKTKRTPRKKVVAPTPITATVTAVPVVEPVTDTSSISATPVTPISTPITSVPTIQSASVESEPITEDKVVIDTNPATEDVIAEIDSTAESSVDNDIFNAFIDTGADVSPAEDIAPTLTAGVVKQDTDTAINEDDPFNFSFGDDFTVNDSEEASDAPFDLFGDVNKLISMF